MTNGLLAAGSAAGAILVCFFNPLQKRIVVDDGKEKETEELYHALDGVGDVEEESV